MRAKKHFSLVAMFVAAMAAVPALAVAGAFPALASTVQLTRYPYLTDVVSTNATINWATNQSQTSGYATYGAVGTEACTAHRASGAKTKITVNGVGEQQWMAKITGLSAGTQYCYRIFFSNPTVDLLGTDPSPKFWSMIPAGTSAPFTFAVTSDWGASGSDGTNPDQANLEQQIARSGASFVIGAGDTAYDSGNQTNYGDLFQTGANISDVFGPSFWKNVGDGLPMFNTMGNHGQNSTFLGVWPQAAAVASSGGRYQMDTYCCVNGTTSASYPSSWYAFDAGEARVYMLDASWSNGNLGTGTLYSDDKVAHWTVNDPEYKWLVSDLAAHPSGLKFAALHFPMYSDSPTEGTDTYMHGPGSVGALLSQYSVPLVFNGHAHYYERNAVQTGETFASYVVGAGGATLEPVGGCGSYDAYAVGWSPTTTKGSACGAAPVPTSASQVFSFLLVSVNGSQVTVTPTDETGRAFDVQTYTVAATSTLPDTVIDSSPATQTNQTSATFTFHSTQTPATFQCQLDSAPAQACNSGSITYPGPLVEGQHHFSAQATTTAGTDPTPATAAWTVDTTPPTAPVLTATASTSSTTVNLAWTASTDTNGIAGYDITRNGSPLASVSGATLSYSDTTGLANTTYQYQVIARDPAGNTSASNTAQVTTGATSSTGPALVQSAGTATSTVSTTSTVTLPGPSNAGGLLVLSAGVYAGLTNQIASVTDSAGNIWTRIGAYAVSGHNSDGEMWCSTNAKSVTTVTAHTSSATTMALEVQEFSGIATTGSLDIAAGSSNTSTTAASGSVTPTASNDLVVGFVAGHSNAEAITGAPGYTAQTQQSTTGTGITSVITGFQVMTSANAQAMTGTFASAMYWAAGVATFKAG